jgi:hypothetical protein
MQVASQFIMYNLQVGEGLILARLEMMGNNRLSVRFTLLDRVGLRLNVFN